jgi:glucokinase
MVKVDEFDTKPSPPATARPYPDSRIEPAGATTMILAADVGASNTRVALFESSNRQLTPVSVRKFRNRDYPDLESSLEEFLGAQTVVDCACFGVAGPVVGGRVELTNCSWVVDGVKIAGLINTARVYLLNDMEATGYGIAQLKKEDLLTLNAGEPDENSGAALIASGTGLGEAMLYGNGFGRIPVPAEAGHADFAPNTEVETELLRYLRDRFHHVSWDRVLSGPGLLLIYEFLRDTVRGTANKDVAEQIRAGDPGAAISHAAMQGSCELCVQALDLFVGIYGAETGNLALRTLARGGVYVAGGIAPKIRQKLVDGRFMRAFLDKGRMRPLLESIPVHLVLTEEAALLGAAEFAYRNYERTQAAPCTATESL